MVHYEVVQYLMDCCGITYSPAVQALRSNDWDLWQAEASIRNNKMWGAKNAKNRPRQQRIPGAPVTHVYAVARLKDGGTQFEVMTRKQIELVRSLSKAGNNGPWVTHWEEMAKKTAIRRLFKYLPVSIEIQRAVSMDEKEPLTIDPADSSVLTGEYSVIDNSEE